MQRFHLKSLAVPMALAFVLLGSGSASAGSIFGGKFDGGKDGGKFDLGSIFAAITIVDDGGKDDGPDVKDDGKNVKRKIIRIKRRLAQVRERDKKPSKPMPEPSAALVFGTGLLVASGFARKRR